MTLLSSLQDRRKELEEIQAPFADWNSVKAWHTRTRALIFKHFGDHVAKFDELIEVKWYRGIRIYSLDGERRPSGNNNEKRRNDSIAAGKKADLLAFIDSIVELATEEHVPAALPKEGGHDVFLVHGHSDRWKHEVARFLEAIETRVIILDEQPSRGRTIIEKLEASSANAGFAVVLLTADDRGGPRAANAKSFKSRARQNVILELGYFVGRFGRERVCCLYDEGVELPSDIHGVVYIPLTASGDWSVRVAREMRAAGLPVDLNKAL